MKVYMSNPDQAAAAIRELLAKALQYHREGILTTADADGRPHATWMGSVTTPDMVDLITLTSVHSHKVTNIRANPHVEWMFTLPDRQSMIYFSGTARIVADEKEKESYYQAVPERSRAFFMKHHRAGGEWCVIKTHLKTARYCTKGTYMTVNLSEQKICLFPRAPI